MEAVGVSPCHTTLPRDEEIVFDVGGSSHLVLAAGPSASVDRLLASWRWHGNGPLELIGWTRLPAPAAPAADQLSEVVVADESDAIRLLARRLKSAVVGLRVYVSAPETTVRRAQAVAAAAGLLHDEIGVEIRGARVRRVYCAHCHAVTEQVSTSAGRCGGCERVLVVHHHFSRRHGAHLGFQADAEVHGEVPGRNQGWA